MQLDNDAILAAARMWKPEAQYFGKITIGNVRATYAMSGGVSGHRTGDIFLHIETNAGLIEIHEFASNSQGTFPYSRYSTHYQEVSFDDGVTNTLTINGQDPRGTTYTVTLRKIE